MRAFFSLLLFWAAASGAPAFAEAAPGNFSEWARRLKDPETKNRKAAVSEALAMIPPSSRASDAIASAVEEETDEGVWFLMVSALGSLPLTESSETALLKTLAHADVSHRLAASDAISHRGTDATHLIPKLLARASAAGADRLAAARTLAHLGGLQTNAEVIPVLFAAFKKENTHSKIVYAAAVLSWASGAASEREAVAEATTYSLGRLQELSADPDTDATSWVPDYFGGLLKNPGPGATEFRRQLPPLLRRLAQGEKEDTDEFQIVVPLGVFALNADLRAQATAKDSLFRQLLEFSQESNSRFASTQYSFSVRDTLRGHEQRPSGDKPPVAELLLSIASDETLTDAVRSRAVACWQHAGLASLGNFKARFRQIPRVEGSPLDQNIKNLTE